MLRKRSRAVQNQSRGHLVPDSASASSISSDAVPQKARGTPFFSFSGLFVGLCAKGLPDSDSARSPTSPLDCRAFSSLGSSFASPPRSPGLEGHPRSWVCGRVGLGLVDSLNDQTNPCGRVLGFSESKSILFGSQMRINIPSPKTHLDGLGDDPLGAVPSSLPKQYGVSLQNHMGSPYCQSGRPKMKPAPGSIRAELQPGEFEKTRSCSAEIGRSSMPLSRLMYRSISSNPESFSSDSENLQLESPPLARGGKNIDNFSGSLPISINSCHGSMGSLSASEIELSEDYTCIISHGPNPKTTHIFGDCILESHKIQSPDYTNKNQEERGGSPWIVICSEGSPPLPSDDFLSFCFSCNKILEGKDIYIYRGEKAFCSCDCRDQEISIEEEMKKPATDSFDSLSSSFHEEIIFSGMVVAA